MEVDSQEAPCKHGLGSHEGIPESINNRSQATGSTSGDKNSTCPLVITSEIKKEQAVLPKALVLQDECFRMNYLRKSYHILLTYVLYCIRF